MSPDSCSPVKTWHFLSVSSLRIFRVSGASDISSRDRSVVRPLSDRFPGSKLHNKKQHRGKKTTSVTAGHNLTGKHVTLWVKEAGKYTPSQQSREITSQATTSRGNNVTTGYDVTENTSQATTSQENTSQYGSNVARKHTPSQQSREHVISHNFTGKWRHSRERCHNRPQLHRKISSKQGTMSQRTHHKPQQGKKRHRERCHNRAQFPNGAQQNTTSQQRKASQQNTPL